MEKASTHPTKPVSLNTAKTESFGLSVLSNWLPWLLCLAGWVWILAADFNFYQRHLLTGYTIIALALTFKKLESSATNSTKTVNPKNKIS